MQIENNTLLRVEPHEIINGIFVVSDGITSIGAEAFGDCSDLTSITLPDSITSIGNYAFVGCSGLTSITLPDGIMSIGNGAFVGCSGLTSITLPDGIMSIGNFAFVGCSGLTSITLPDSITSIGDNAFRGCSRLTSIILPDSITSIGDNAFRGCSGLTSITLPDGIMSIGNGAFWGCSGLTSITLPDGIMSIGNGAFIGCSGLTSINIIATTPEEFERIQSLLPDDLRPNAHDVINELRVEIETFEQYITDTPPTDGELNESELTTIKQLQSKLDSIIGSHLHQPMQQKINDIRMMLFLNHHQLKKAVTLFIDTPKPSTSMTFELANALVASSNTIEAYQFILRLFKDHDEDEDVRTLLERSVLNILSRLSKEQPASLSDRLADYTIDRCLPCSSILNTINQTQGLDEDLRKQLINKAEFLLPNELRQLIDTAQLKDAFTEQYDSTNLVTYESILLLSNKEEVDAVYQYQQNPLGTTLSNESQTILQQVDRRACALESTQHQELQPMPVASSLSNIGLFPTDKPTNSETISTPPKRPSI